MQWAVAIALGLFVAFVATPSSWVVLRELVVYLLADLLALACVLVRVYRYRPNHPRAWLFIGGGLFAFLIADVIWGSYTARDLDPFPSLADLFYLGAYGTTAGAPSSAAALTRRPGPRSSRRPMIRRSERSQILPVSNSLASS